MRCVADDAIYAEHSLHSIPHRMRVRRILSEIRSLSLRDVSYADIGCGGGSITQRIVEVLQPARAVAYDPNPGLIEDANRLFPGISFRVGSLTQTSWSGEMYGLVTCLETLEHVGDLERAVDNLLRMTAQVLFITVPIEIGLLGTAKFVGKTILGRKPLTDEHTGSSWAYLQALASGGDLAQFRTHMKGDHWISHTGFDYRRIDAILESRRVSFVARNRGWNRFYRILAQKSDGSRP